LKNLSFFYISLRIVPYGLVVTLTLSLGCLGKLTAIEMIPGELQSRPEPIGSATVVSIESFTTLLAQHAWSNSAYQEALQQSLYQSGIFTEVEGEPDFDVSVNVLLVEKLVNFGKERISGTASMCTDWNVNRRADGMLIYQSSSANRSEASAKRSEANLRSWKT
jgi:hypothetical protein